MIVDADGLNVLTARVPGQSVPFGWDLVDKAKLLDEK